MDKNVIKEIWQEHEGQTYVFPLGALAKNIETDAARRFVSDEEMEDLKVVIDEELSENSANPLANKAIAAKLKTMEDAMRQMREILGSKADVLMANREVYVSTVGSDGSGDGTQGKPWRTIQKAIDNIPPVVGSYNYTIHIGAGSYPGFTATGVTVILKPQGDITLDSAGLTYVIEGNAADVTILKESGYMTIAAQQNNGQLIYIHNGGKLKTYGVNFRLTGGGNNKGFWITTDSGVSQNGGTSTLSGFSTAIDVSGNSVFFAKTLSGSNNKTGINVESGGRVSYETNGMTAEIMSVTASGGRIYTGSQE